MLSRSKGPTPQEIMQQRRQREEQERTAYLPPGLINHGNTCFMNSVIQGLIATQLLSDLVHFAPIPASVQERSSTLLAGQRSPQLTNGHNLSGPYEKPWVNTMPIGDVFLSIMYKSWDAQAKRQKDSLISPRALLGALGKKYDQYLDFAQQDAHEFLRILLDAMRMEEFDIIKKRQPPPPPAPKTRSRRSTVVHSQQPTVSPTPTPALDPSTDNPSSPSSIPTPTAPSAPLPPQPLSEDERLVSFADLIFGGKLTSILVCQKCKNVSQTYEDFNDISLSIKPEDYIHRKRDKLKNFAKRLTVFPTGGSSSNNLLSGSTSASNSTPPPSRPHPHPHFPLHVPAIHRPSSVPPSPKERPDGQLVPRDEPPPTSNVRRRSLDVPPESGEKSLDSSDDHHPHPNSPPPPTPPTAVVEDTSTSSTLAGEGTESSHILVNLTGPEGKHIEFVEVSGKPESKKEKDKEKRRSQVEENWAKLGRRFSLGLGGGKSKDRKSRSEERQRSSLSSGKSISPPIVEGVALQPPAGELQRKPRFSSDSVASSSRPSLGSIVQAVAGRTPSPDARTTFTSTGPVSSDVVDHPATPPSSSSTAVAPSSSPRPSGGSSSLQHLSPTVPITLTPSPSRSKSPKPPRATAAEAEYLRKILADVTHTSSGTNPLSTLFRPSNHEHKGHQSQGHHHHLPGHGHHSSVWLGMHQLSGIEECLRMFTAVEVLDGENMVGCRRCWKIANGQMVSRKDGGGGASGRRARGSGEFGVGALDEDDDSDEGGLGSPPQDSLGKDNAAMTDNAAALSVGQGAVGSKPKRPPPLPVHTNVPSPGSVHIPTSISTPTVSHWPEGEVHHHPYSPTDNRSISSLPTAPTAASSASQLDDSAASSTGEEDGVDLEEGVGDSSGSGDSGVFGDIRRARTRTPGGLPIPVIETTEAPPDHSVSSVVNGIRIVAPQPTKAAPPSLPALARLTNVSGGTAARSTDSLSVPSKKGVGRGGRLRQGHGEGGAEDDATEDEEVLSSAYESDTSFGTSTSVSGESGGETVDTPREAWNGPPGLEGAMTTASQGAAAASGVKAQGPNEAVVPVMMASSLTAKPTPVVMPVKKPQASKPKPTIMRPAYKRYLIDTPPPVLVIHLKRFQQLSKTPFLSFSHGFKKLDDYVTFPEYLDLTPYLAPKKEDYGLGKGQKKSRGLGKEKEKERDEEGRKKDEEKKEKEKKRKERCIYRLYAVVVHIGNMLGGHYIAYTALPTKSPVEGEGLATKNLSSPPSSNPASSSADASSTPGPSSSSNGEGTPGPTTPGNVATSPSISPSTSKSDPTDKPPPPQQRQWAYISDTIVRLTTLEEVLNAKAYICMYERC